MTALEVLLQIVLLLLPLVLIGIVVYRMRRVVRMIQDPEQLGSLLSEPVRDAVRKAGMDPSAISLRDLEGNEELRQLVSADLRAAILRRLTRRAPAPGGTRTVSSARTQVSLPRPELEGAGLPPPIDGRRSSDGIRRWLLALVVGGAIAALVMLWR